MKLTWPDSFINKVICRDCLKILPLIPDGAVDAVITDPPYNTTQNDWDAPLEFEKFWPHIKRITHTVIATSSQPFTTDLINSNRSWFKYEWIWCKTRCSDFLNSNTRPLKQHENICVFTGIGAKYNPQGLICQRSDNSRPAKRQVRISNYGQQKEHKFSEFTNFPTTLLSIPNPKNEIEETLHPTQKPVALMSYLIQTYSGFNNLILDPYAGSGSTLVAAKQLGRRYIGIEISPKYCKIAEQRLAQEQFDFTAQPPKAGNSTGNLPNSNELPLTLSE